jgi:alanine racemase
MAPARCSSALDLGLKPVMTLKSEIIAVQQVKPGDTAGYGRLFRRVATRVLA